MLTAHLVKLVDTAAALVRQYQDPPNPIYTETDHGLQQCLVLIAHLVKLIDAAAALVCQYQSACL